MQWVYSLLLLYCRFFLCRFFFFLGLYCFPECNNYSCGGGGVCALLLLTQVAATQANEAAQNLKKAAAKSKQEEMHLFAKTPGEESLAGRIKNWGDKIKKLQVRIIRTRVLNKCTLLQVGGRVAYDCARHGSWQVTWRCCRGA